VDTIALTPLPKELVALITSRLPTRDICSLEATCTALRAALRTPQARLADNAQLMNFTLAAFANTVA